MIVRLGRMRVCLAYQTHQENFTKNASNSSHVVRNQTPKSNRNSSLVSDTAAKKQPKIDKMKHANQFLENDENFRPAVNNVPKETEKKKNALYRWAFRSSFLRCSYDTERQIVYRSKQILSNEYWKENAYQSHKVFRRRTCRWKYSPFWFALAADRWVSGLKRWSNRYEVLSTIKIISTSLSQCVQFLSTFRTPFYRRKQRLCCSHSTSMVGRSNWVSVIGVRAFEIFSRKRTSTNQSSTSVIRFEHATNNSTSPYFSQRTDNRIKRHLSNGESRVSPLKNIHSKPLNNTRLWDHDGENHSYDWRDSPYLTKRTENQSSTDISLSQAITTTMSLRKKG
jgi:hypothetical protein